MAPAEPLMDAERALAAPERGATRGDAGPDVLDPEPAVHHPLSARPDRNLRKATA
ncbi:hypothetical protein [Streptomyces sp. NPDC101776]|uniref:hypothetical protein n=1 Tax=Streptomyces sp. NPDC101776 TaxID=3366146 RepID=UPI00381E6F80